MQIGVSSSRCATSEEIREWAERRVLFALGQFAPHLRSVAVRLGDENGPRGGVDQSCRMQARLVRGDLVVAEVVDSDPCAAISRAAERLGRQVRTALERARSARRLTQHSPASSRKSGKRGST